MGETPMPRLIMADPVDDQSLPWTLPQRRAILVIFSLVLIYLIYVAIRDRQYVPDPLPPQSSLAGQLMDKVDPNTADLATLAALPNLGEKRAAAIIAYRERVQAREPGATAFRTSADLLKIRGIGVAMIANLRPYLALPDVPMSEATTAPMERPAD